MTQITRCPVCQTMFKVVADQFKAAQGWVRCGYCGEVFDAGLHLVPHAEAAAQNVLTLDGKGEPDGGTQALPESAEVAPAVPASAESGLATLNPTDAQAANPQAEAAQDAENAQTHDTAHVAEPAPVVPAAPEVSFVRDAKRKAFWRKSLVRGFLGLLSLVLLTALLLQWVLQQKDNLAAMDPRLAPFLQTLCISLECEIRPPRHIESVVIDSSNFSKTSPDVYHLSFVLKNTSAVKLEIPSVEITLTDAQDQALVRRVLTPQQFGAATVSLAAHAELTGAVTLKVSGETAPDALPAPSLPVNGYRILAFYP